MYGATIYWDSDDTFRRDHESDKGAHVAHVEEIPPAGSGGAERREVIELANLASVGRKM